MGKNDAEWNLLDRAALAAFGAFMSQYKENNPPIGEIAGKAWEAAAVFVNSRKEHEMGRYAAVLHKYNGLEALRRIAELDGNGGQYLDFMIKQYANEPDPLRAYAEDNIGPRRTAGQIAIARYLEKWAGEGTQERKGTVEKMDGLF